ncbi:MAG: ABC transporter ATP-binding protein [Candidatus Bathyarchaeia archaeon]
MNPIIELIDVWKGYRYRQGYREVLKGVNLKVYKGEFACILGPNGSGKTTLLKIIGGYLKPDRGSVKIGDVKIEDLDGNKLLEFRREKIGFVFQEDLMFEVITVYENLEVPLLPLIKDRKIRRERILEALKKLGISELADRFPDQLSGGEKRKVSLARALLNNPPILLVDEPTSNLDRESAEEYLEQLLKLNKIGVTILVATHDERIKKYVERRLYLKNGRITAENS